jgi:hypothetical protein
MKTVVLFPVICDLQGPQAHPRPLTLAKEAHVWAGFNANANANASNNKTKP